MNFFFVICCWFILNFLIYINFYFISLFIFLKIVQFSYLLLLFFFFENSLFVYLFLIHLCLIFHHFLYIFKLLITFDCYRGFFSILKLSAMKPQYRLKNFQKYFQKISNFYSVRNGHA
jgi:hypothetical protein